MSVACQPVGEQLSSKVGPEGFRAVGLFAQLSWSEVAVIGAELTQLVTAGGPPCICL